MLETLKVLDENQTVVGRECYFALKKDSKLVETSFSNIFEK